MPDAPDAEPKDWLIKALAALEAVGGYTTGALAIAGTIILLLPTPIRDIDLTPLRQSWGGWITALTILFGALTVAKLARTVHDAITGKRRSVHLIANSRQSSWVQSKQSDGRVTTQLSLEIQVTNLTYRSIRLHEDIRLLRPWTRARPLPTVLTPNRIDPKAVASVRCVILFNRAIGRAGRPLTTVIKISDQFGRWHKLKTRLPYMGAGR